MSRDSIILIEYDLRALRREGRRGYSKTGYMFTYKYIPEEKEEKVRRHHDAVAVEALWMG